MLTYTRSARTVIQSRLNSICAMILAGLFAVSSAMAQQPDSKGTEFWLMFNDNLVAPTMSLFITGDIATNGVVDIPGLAFSVPFNVVPGTVTTVEIPAAAEVNTVDTLEEKGIHVTATDEVTVYGLNQAAQTTDAFLGLPADILGTDYINQGYSSALSQFGVVATEANTTVTITPTVAFSVHAAGVPFDVVMQEGSTYQARGGLDLSGSLITSDKPIAVFGGNQCTNIPEGFGFCDHIVEQLPPTGTWGQAFVTVPLATRTAGDTFRVLASQDNTTVLIDGAFAALINRGEIFETNLLDASVINADNPVLVTQYSNGTQWDNVTSDPFEVVVPPFEQFLAAYTISTPATVFEVNFANVVTAAAGVGAVTLDGVVIPVGDFSPIGASGFSGAQIPLTVGSHTMDGPLPFGVIVYGFADFDSYGYPGGLGLAEVAELATLTLNPPSAINPVNTEHCVVATTLDQNSVPLPGIRVDFEVSGVHSTSGFEFTDENGEAEFCYTGTIAGEDTIAAVVGGLSVEASKTWTDEAEVLICDTDADGDIDRRDIRIILRARGQNATGPDDPRDANGDGRITRRDVKECTKLI